MPCFDNTDIRMYHGRKRCVMRSRKSAAYIYIIFAVCLLGSLLNPAYCSDSYYVSAAAPHHAVSAAPVHSGTLTHMETGATVRTQPWSDSFITAGRKESLTDASEKSVRWSAAESVSGFCRTSLISALLNLLLAAINLMPYDCAAQASAMLHFIHCGYGFI